MIFAHDAPSTFMWLINNVSHAFIGIFVVIQRMLTQLLLNIINKNLKDWEDFSSFIEFAYTRAMHSIASYSRFEIVYGFIPLTPSNLVHLHIDERDS